MSNIKPPEFRMNFSEKPVRNITLKGTLKYFKQKFKASYAYHHPFWTSLIATIILVCFLSGLVFGTVLGYIKTAPPVTEDQLSIKQLTTFIYDDKNNQIAELKGSDNKNSILVQDKDISPYVKKAIVAIEDERFESHHGIDLKRSLGATVNFIFSAGGSGYGGSTITQQVVRLLTGDSMRSVKRKVQEQWRAVQLEQKIKKWQILELYLNLIYLGNSYYGVESASLGYFNKHAKDLTLAESACIAGITNAPSRYNPYTEEGQKNTLERQRVILDKMLELGPQGYQGGITKEEYDKAINEKIVFAPKPAVQKETSTQSYFVDQVVKDVKNDLMTRNGMSEDAALKLIYNHGLKIYTTESMDIQGAMDNVFINDKANIPDTGKAEHPQAAMVIIDPANGQVKAMYGGYGKKEGSTLNRATSQYGRQAGSSFKPIAVYGPAIDMGIINPNSIYDDKKLFLNGADKPYYPKNSPDTFDGKMTIRTAIAKSKNTIAAEVFMDLGVDNSIEYLKKVGIDRDNPEEKNVSLALGGLHQGVNPYQMAAAYVPFDNGGLYYQPVTYTKVINSEGKVLLENKPTFNKAYSEDTSNTMTDLLHGVVDPDGIGTARGIGLINGGRIPVAGKTGTTNSNIDSWFVGYTPYYVGAVWYGYDNKIKPISIDGAETRRAQTIWKLVMDKVHDNLPARAFGSITDYKPSGGMTKATQAPTQNNPGTEATQPPATTAPTDSPADPDKTEPPATTVPGTQAPDSTKAPDELNDILNGL